MHHAIKKGSPEHLAERSHYLNSLMQEFLDTKEETTTTKPGPSTKKKTFNKPIKEMQEQLIANLANFSYDPYNHSLFLELGIHETVFLQVLEEKIQENREVPAPQNVFGQKVVEFALAGLSNCSAHPRLRRDLISKEVIELILSINTLNSSSSVDALTSSLSALVFLTGPDTMNILQKLTITLQNFIQVTQHHTDKRVRNLAAVLLENLRKLGLRIRPSSEVHI